MSTRDGASSALEAESTAAASSSTPSAPRIVVVGKENNAVDDDPVFRAAAASSKRRGGLRTPGGGSTSRPSAASSSRKKKPRRQHLSDLVPRTVTIAKSSSSGAGNTAEEDEEEQETPSSFLPPPTGARTRPVIPPPPASAAAMTGTPSSSHRYGTRHQTRSTPSSARSGRGSPLSKRGGRSPGRGSMAPPPSRERLSRAQQQSSGGRGRSTELNLPLASRGRERYERDQQSQPYGDDPHRLRRYGPPQPLGAPAGMDETTPIEDSRQRHQDPRLQGRGPGGHQMLTGAGGNGGGASGHAKDNLPPPTFGSIAEDLDLAAREADQLNDVLRMDSFDHTESPPPPPSSGIQMSSSEDRAVEGVAKMPASSSRDGPTVLRPSRSSQKRHRKYKEDPRTEREEQCERYEERPEEPNLPPQRPPLSHQPPHRHEPLSHQRPPHPGQQPYHPYQGSHPYPYQYPSQDGNGPPRPPQHSAPHPPPGPYAHPSQHVGGPPPPPPTYYHGSGHPHSSPPSQYYPGYPPPPHHASPYGPPPSHGAHPPPGAPHPFGPPPHGAPHLQQQQPWSSPPPGYPGSGPDAYPSQPPPGAPPPLPPSGRHQDQRLTSKVKSATLKPRSSSNSSSRGSSADATDAKARGRAKSWSSRSGTMVSPPPKKRRIYHSADSWESPPKETEGGEGRSAKTPEKNVPSKDGASTDFSRGTSRKVSSPYRSPEKVDRSSSSRKSKRSPPTSSPLFTADTPNAGYCEGFNVGVETPGALQDATQLGVLSPMGPAFPAGFALPDETATFPTGDEGDSGNGRTDVDANFGIARAGSTDSGAGGRGGRRSGRSTGGPRIRQRKADEGSSSPFSSFMGELSPLEGSIRIHGSPANNRDRRDTQRGGGPSPFPTLAKGRGSVPPKAATLQASPMAAPPSNQKGQPDGVWPSPGPFRIRLGNVGMENTAARKGMEGINNVLRGSPPSSHRRPEMSTPSYATGSSRASDFRIQPPSSLSRSDLRTPMKAGTTPGTRHVAATPVHSASRLGYTGSAQSQYSRAKYSGGRDTASTQRFLGSAQGKENASPASQKRNPCNCKKSKCLKLYCECFAAERYCEGCNCLDCSNNAAHETIRSKAIADTKAKNPNAFKPRIAVKPVGATTSCNSPSTSHNMGCKCKKSACLKKYCECFEAGVMCSSKCKCIECLNYVGSQALIDRRRKIKDHKGAELAMRTADQAWKGGRPEQEKAGSRTPSMPPHSILMPSPVTQPSPHQMSHSMMMSPMMHPSPGHFGGPPPPYMAPNMMVPPHPAMAYHNMGMQPPTPYSSSKQSMRGSTHHSGARNPSSSSGRTKQIQRSRPVSTTQRTTGIRKGFDPHSSKKKKTTGIGKEEPKKPYFGPTRPMQSKTTTLTIFSYLSNDDIYNASLVSKAWSGLALDDELWQLP